MPLPTDISVVICTHSKERWDLLVRAVESVEHQEEQPTEIILVVDHNPALASEARRAWPNVTVLDNEQPPGLSGARNTGSLAASGRVVAFLDDDAAAEPTWISRLSRHFTDATVMGVGGTVQPEWENDRPSWAPPEFDWVVGCTYTGMPTVTAPVRNMLGANMAFRRAELLQVGGFASQVGRTATSYAGCEETEVCIRLRKVIPEALILFDPDVKVRHHVPAWRARWRYFVARCYAEGRSKATVAEMTGSADALSTERAYVQRVLPQAVARELSRRPLSREGLARIFAIGLGLTSTTSGYVYEAVRRRGMRMGSTTAHRLLHL